MKQITIADFTTETHVDRLKMKIYFEDKSSSLALETNDPSGIYAL